MTSKSGDDVRSIVPPVKAATLPLLEARTVPDSGDQLAERLAQCTISARLPIVLSRGEERLDIAPPTCYVHERRPTYLKIQISHGACAAHR